MSLEDTIIRSNINDIKIIFVVATVILVIALIQKLIPTFSITYHTNNKPPYLKAKFISKLLTSAILYLGGFFLYFFVNLTEPSMYSFFALWIPIILYHVLKWGLTKLFEKEK